MNRPSGTDTFSYSASRLICSFVIGVNVFLSIVLILPLDYWNEKYQEQVEKEKLISKTAYEGYFKYLDSLYFNLASFIVPVSGFLAWRFLIREKIRVFLYWIVAVGWLLTSLFVLASSAVWL
jgi:hypothetical protein